jgi:hypothetical protein
MVAKKIYTLYYFRSVSSGLWYWRLIGPKQKVIAHSESGYSTSEGLRKAVKKMRFFDFDYILMRTSGQDELKEDLILK